MGASFPGCKPLVKCSEAQFSTSTEEYIDTSNTLIDPKNKVTKHLHFLTVLGIKVDRVDVPMYFGLRTH